MATAGSFRNVVQIRRRGTGRDAAGQPIKGDYLPVATIRADIRFTGGLEAIRSDQPTSIKQASMRTWFRKDITEGMQAVCEGVVYDIQSVLPNLQNRRHIDIVCKVVTGAVV